MMPKNRFLDLLSAGVVVPDSLLERMSRAKNKQHSRALGVEIATELIEEDERLSGRVCCQRAVW